MAANLSTVNVATRGQVEQTVMSYVAQGFTVSTQTDDTTTLYKKKEFNVVWAVIGFFACVIPLIIYCIVYSMESDQMVVVRLDPAAAALSVSPILGASTGAEGLRWSEDRRYWWDSTTWIDAERTVPPGAQYAEDGRWWWDGQSWRAIPAPTGTPVALGESAPETAIADDPHPMISDEGNGTD